MEQELFIVPQGRLRGWWVLQEDGNLICSLCERPAGRGDLTTCPSCHANMTIDETWIKRILERSYSREN